MFNHMQCFVRLESLSTCQLDKHSFSLTGRDYAGVDLQWKTYKTTSTLFQRAQFAFTGLSMVMEFASFVNSAYVAENTDGKLEDVVVGRSS